MASHLPPLLSASLILSHLSSGLVSATTTFTFLNQCNYSVWPATLSNAGISSLSSTGFTLRRGESTSIAAPSGWGGRFWARTRCKEDPAGRFSCVTADCGSGKPECNGAGAVPPATLAEFTLDGADGLDFFDVSLVDGFNLPVLVTPHGGGSGGNCNATGCPVDLNGMCPEELRVTAAGGQSVACKSACEAFGKAEYCCSGPYNSPEECKPTSYSEAFKKACPRAYSYAYDDKTSTFTCSGADYLITFCPSPTSRQKSSSGVQNPVAVGSDPPADMMGGAVMAYDGGLVSSGAVCLQWIWSIGITALYLGL